MCIMADFWTKTRFLVTGSTGFVGSHLTEALYKRGASQRNLTLTPHRYQCDLRDRDTVRTVLDDCRPDVIIHLAASVGGIGANRERPAEFIYDNLVMGTHLIHEAHRAEVEKVVVLGTVCSYPKYTPVPFRENKLWDGYPEETNAAYGIAKRALLTLGEAYRQQYGMNIIHLLPTNMYGPADDFNPKTSHVIPALIRRTFEAIDRRDKTLTIWGTGTATRDFLYVEDAVEAILQAVQVYDDPEPLNLGSGHEVRIGDLASLIVELTGYQGTLAWDRSKPDGQPRRVLETTRAEQLIGWRASTGFRDGLRRTIEWYRNSRHALAAD